MTELLWQSLRKSDVQDLHTFCCVPDEGTWRGRPPAPAAPWCNEAQSFIRQGWPRRPPRYMLVGRDADGIGAAARFREEDRGAFYLIEVVAVANHRRGQQIGDEAMGQVVDAVTQLAVERGVRTTRLQGNVHQDNKASLAMVERWGFRQQWRDGNYLAFAADLYLPS